MKDYITVGDTIEVADIYGRSNSEIMIVETIHQLTDTLVFNLRKFEHYPIKLVMRV
jgi:hypothetical protein